MRKKHDHTKSYELAHAVKAAWAIGSIAQDQIFDLLEEIQLLSGSFLLPPECAPKKTTRKAPVALTAWTDAVADVKQAAKRAKVAKRTHGGARRGSGRKAGVTNADNVVVSLRVTPRAREILRQQARPGQWLSKLIEQVTDSEVVLAPRAGWSEAFESQYDQDSAWLQKHDKDCAMCEVVDDE